MLRGVVPRTKRFGPRKLELTTAELVQQLRDVLQLDAIPKRIAHTSGGARQGNVLLSKRGGFHFFNFFRQSDEIPRDRSQISPIFLLCSNARCNHCRSLAHYAGFAHQTEGRQRSDHTPPRKDSIQNMEYESPDHTRHVSITNAKEPNVPEKTWCLSSTMRARLNSPFHSSVARTLSFSLLRAARQDHARGRLWKLK